jgi:hypothetical protein
MESHYYTQSTVKANVLLRATGKLTSSRDIHSSVNIKKCKKLSPSVKKKRLMKVLIFILRP